MRHSRARSRAIEVYYTLRWSRRPASGRHVMPIGVSPVATERWRSRRCNTHALHDPTAIACQIAAGLMTMPAVTEHDARRRLAAPHACSQRQAGQREPNRDDRIQRQRRASRVAHRHSNSVDASHPNTPTSARGRLYPLVVVTPRICPACHAIGASSVITERCSSRLCGTHALHGATAVTCHIAAGS